MADQATSMKDCTKKKARDGAEKPPRTLRDVLKVLGYAHNVAGDRIGIAVRLRQKGARAHVIPIVLTGRYNAVGLERHILDSGLDAVLSVLKVTEFGTALRSLAAKKRVVVISERGFHQIAFGDETSRVTVWNGHLHWFGEPHPLEVVLVGKAHAREALSGTSKTWLAAFERVIESNPRLVVPICTSLSAALRRPFGELAFISSLVAQTSVGKSTVQNLGCSLLSPPNLITWNATKAGIQDWLADKPDQPAFIEDLHKADRFEDIAQVVMSTGNSAGRILSNRSEGGGQSTPIQTTLIVSTEKSIASMAVNASGGLLARYFEIHAGAFGMFDDLCGYKDGGDLAKHLMRSARANHGTVWPKWIELISKEWPQVKELHNQHLPGVRDAILKEAGSPNLDEVTGRLVDRLAFAAFSGCVATELCLWSIRKATILAAFGLLLREHIRRAPPGRNAIEEAALDEVRTYIETHRGSFVPLLSANDPNARDGFSGYFLDDPKRGRLYLFPTGAFRRLFGHLGEEVYAVLKRSGHLATQEDRHNTFQRRMPKGPDGKRRSVEFVAVKDSVRYVPKS